MILITLPDFHSLFLYPWPYNDGGFRPLTNRIIKLRVVVFLSQWSPCFLNLLKWEVYWAVGPVRVADLKTQTAVGFGADYVVWNHLATRCISLPGVAWLHCRFLESPETRLSNSNNGLHLLWEVENVPNSIEDALGQLDILLESLL